MRLTEFMVVIIAALLFLLPTMKQEKTANEIEAQEAEPYEETYSDYDTFKITYRVSSARSEPVADIIWMKKAAEVATEEGIPYFNVLEQKVSKRFVREAGRELSVIEGIIELDPDPMRAEFDAHEIESLVLTEAP